jgi:putative DNA primase/helicase
MSSCGGEDTEIRTKVLDFINAHGAARFSALHPCPDASELIVRDRAGWWEEIEDTDGSSNRIYLFTRGALKEATKGYDFSRVLQALDNAEALPKKDTANNAKSFPTRTPDGRQPRLYWINPERLESDG